jgi:hypothetical protein
MIPGEIYPDVGKYMVTKQAGWDPDDCCGKAFVTAIRRFNGDYFLCKEKATPHSDQGCDHARCPAKKYRE